MQCGKTKLMQPSHHHLLKRNPKINFGINFNVYSDEKRLLVVLFSAENVLEKQKEGEWKWMREGGRRTSHGSQFVREFLQTFVVLCVWSSTLLCTSYISVWVLSCMGHVARLLGQEEASLWGKNLPVFICLTWTVVSVSILFVFFLL